MMFLKRGEGSGDRESGTVRPPLKSINLRIPIFRNSFVGVEARYEVRESKLEAG
jgi:hypothetical protein